MQTALRSSIFLAGAASLAVFAEISCVGDDPRVVVDDDTTADAGATPDGGTADTPLGCDLSRPFTTSVQIGDVRAADLWLEPDELRGIASEYDATASADAGGNVYRLRRVERPSLAAPFTFAAADDLEAINASGSARGGTLSENRRTLLFFSNRDGAFAIWGSTRDATTGPFPEPVKLAAPVAGSPALLHPEWITSSYVLVASNGGSTTALHRLTWNGSELSSASELTELTPARPVRGSMTADQEIVVYASGITGTLRMYEARRSGATFGGAQELSALASAQGEYLLYLSRDGCRLYYTNDGSSADLAIHMATRE